MSSRQNKMRHAAIKELVQKHAIEDQESLVKLLQEEHKIDTNQSIVSRDLRQLGVGKKIVEGIAIYQMPSEDPTREILRLAVIGVEKNEVMMIVHTIGGLAAFVGDYLDHHKDEGFLAALAGENVVFVVPQSIKNIDRVYAKLCEILHYHASTKKNQKDSDE